MNEEDIKKMKSVKGEVTNFRNTSSVICEKRKHPIKYTL